MKKVIFLLVTATLAFSCKNDTKEAATTDTIATSELENKEQKLSEAENDCLQKRTRKLEGCVSD